MQTGAVKMGPHEAKVWIRHCYRITVVIGFLEKGGVGYSEKDITQRMVHLTSVKDLLSPGSK